MASHIPFGATTARKSDRPSFDGRIGRKAIVHGIPCTEKNPQIAFRITDNARPLRPSNSGKSGIQRNLAARKAARKAHTRGKVITRVCELTRVSDTGISVTRLPDAA